MYADPAALVQARMNDRLREADRERRALRLRREVTSESPSSLVPAPRRWPSILVLLRPHHA
jgi:hypothetical protein